MDDEGDNEEEVDVKGQRQNVMEAVYETMRSLQVVMDNGDKDQNIQNYGQMCYDAFCDRVEKGDPSSDPYISTKS